MDILGAVIAIAFIAVIVFLISRSRKSDSTTPSQPGPGPAPINPEPPKQIKSVPTREELEQMTKTELVDLGRANGAKVNHSHKKSALVDAVSHALKQK